MILDSRNIKICLLALFAICCWQSAHAQHDDQAQGLRQALLHCDWLDRIGERDSSLALLQRTCHQAEKIGNAELVAEARLSLIRHFNRYQLRDSLEKNLDPLIEFSQKNKLPKVKVEAMIFKTIHLLETHRYRPAMEVCDEAIAQAKPLHDKRLDGICLLQKGSVLHTTQNDDKRAQPYYVQALKILEAVGDTAYIIRGNLLVASGEPDTAKSRMLMRRAMTLSNAYTSLPTRVTVLNFSTRFLPPEQSIPVLREALGISQQLRIPNLNQHLLIQLCERYQELEDYPNALVCLDSAVAAFPNNLPDDGALQYYYIYKGMGDYKKAVAAMERFQQEEDERKQTDMKSFVAEWETKLNTREKEWELQQQQDDLKDQRTLNLLLVGILLLVVVAGGGTFFAFYQRGKTLKLLALQNETIRQQAAELESMEKLKSRFFTNVSHELRTPLTLILAPIGTALKSGELSERNASLLGKAQQSGKDLLKLIGSILDLSKLEAGKMKANLEPTLLMPFVQRTAAAFDSYAERHGIHLHFDYQAGEALQLELDREKLSTILQNFLSNALKFTPSGGSISVRVKELPHDMQLSVADTGRGIHAEELPKVFDRFYQASRPLPGQSEAAAEGGTGIGLALCREFAELMGGRVWAESQVGKGSSFYFEFPKKTVAEIENGKLRRENEASGIEKGELKIENEEMIAEVAPILNSPFSILNSRPSILLVEDNHSLRDYLESILSPHYQVITAENGQAALEVMSYELGVERGAVPNSKLITHNFPDLILSDVMMPVMDGFQLLERLKGDEHLQRIPVIMLTARADMQDKLRALRIGVDDYLLKPFDEEELLTRIKNLLGRYQERQAFAQQPIEPITAEEAAAGEEAELAPADAVWLEKIEHLVRSEVQNDLLAVSWLAQRMFVSERQLQRRLKLLTGLSPNQYIREVRLQEARRLLETQAVTSVKEAAYAVSFKDEKYFSQLFRERFGKVPSMF